VIEEEQDIVNDLAGRFFATVQNARGMTAEQLSKVNDGRMFLAKDAVSLKLADAVLTASQAIEKAAAMGAAARGKNGQAGRTTFTASNTNNMKGSTSPRLRVVLGIHQSTGKFKSADAGLPPRHPARKNAKTQHPQRAP
jgi:ClpP class serine protease